MKWSTFQDNVFSFVKADTATGAVNAVPGSGKTTTIVEAVQRSPRPALLVAFNKHIAVELERRLGKSDDLTICTLHSLGLRSIAGACDTKPLVVPSKYSDIADWALHEYSYVWQAASFVTQQDCKAALVKLVDFARLTIRDPRDDTFTAAAACYGLEAPAPLLPVVVACLNEGAAEAKHTGTIDFTDMIWLPNRWELQMDKYPHVFVDEAQDLNPAQLDLVLRSRAPGARGLIVGDPHQAIFGFAYAGLDSFDVARARLKATELPLSICYRCPTSHLDLARELVPHILPRDDAPAGEIVHCFEDELPGHVQQGDLVLCRYTAPLIAQCMTLISHRIRAHVKGRDIGAGMVKLIEQTRKRNANLSVFYHTFAELKDDQHDRLTARQAPALLHEMLDDRLDGVCMIYEIGKPADWPSFTKTALDLCSDNGGGVCLSTVHRAKGLEADRVWLLHPEDFDKRRFGFGGLDQEANVKLVALTRSKHLLGFVHSLDPPPLPFTPRF